jgi:hypothetical protein
MTVPAIPNELLRNNFFTLPAALISLPPYMPSCNTSPLSLCLLPSFHSNHASGRRSVLDEYKGIDGEGSYVVGMSREACVVGGTQAVGCVRYE